MAASYGVDGVPAVEARQIRLEEPRPKKATSAVVLIGVVLVAVFYEPLFFIMISARGGWCLLRMACR